MPSGCSISSARCPSRPAVRASSARPRSSAAGNPRSARAAPSTPAPLIGSSARLLAMDVGNDPQQPQVGTELAGLLRDLVDARGARVLRLVDRVAEAGN